MRWEEDAGLKLQVTGFGLPAHTGSASGYRHNLKPVT
jgi:hypothetical protein